MTETKTEPKTTSFTTIPDGPAEHRQHIVKDRRHGRADAETLGDKVKASLDSGEISSGLPGAEIPQIFLTIIADTFSGKMRLSGNAPNAVAVITMLNTAMAQVLEQIANVKASDEVEVK